MYSILDIEKYISSGILEAYVLGEINPAEKLEVERMISMYPEVRAELALVEESIEAIAFHTQIAPKEDAKKKVLGKAFSEEASDAPKQAVGKGREVPFDRKAVTKGTRQLKPYSYYLAAAVTFALISSFAAFYFFVKWKGAEDRLQLAVSERTAIARNFQTVENRLEQLSSELDIYSNQNFNKIELQGLAVAPEAGATILWNKNTKQVFLDADKLPSIPTDKQYQLWAIIDGQPVDIGLVTNSTNGGLLKMKEVENASAFAITLEPAGGSPSPTLDQMYVMGNTSS